MKHSENHLPSSYGEYLDVFAWEHFVTLTSDRWRTPEQLLRLFVDKFVRQQVANWKTAVDISGATVE